MTDSIEENRKIAKMFWLNSLKPIQHTRATSYEKEKLNRWYKQQYKLHNYEDEFFKEVVECLF